MAEVLGRYVAGDSGVYMSALEARYFEIESPEFFRLEQAGAFDEDVEGLLVRASRVVDVTQLVAIAKAAADYRKALARGQLLEWVAESRDMLDKLLFKGGFLVEGDLLDEGEDDE